MKYEVECEYKIVCKKKFTITARNSNEAAEKVLKNQAQRTDEYKTTYVSDPAVVVVNKLE